MKIGVLTATESNTTSLLTTTETSDLNNSIGTSTTLVQNQINSQKAFFAEDKQEQFNLLITAFRILCSKYQYAAEKLICKILLSRIDSPNKTTQKIFATQIDFPSISQSGSTIEMVFSESKKIFEKFHIIVDQTSVAENYEFALLAFNQESENIELDCTIRIYQDISFNFKAPLESPFAGVISNCDHHFLNILNAIQQMPDQLIGSFSIMDLSEQDYLQRWSEGIYNPDISQPVCLHQLFEHTVKNFPMLPAVFSNGNNFFYKEIDNRANQLARYLNLKGIGKGDYCGILLPRTEEMYIAMLAILKVGAAYIPMDVSIPKDRLQFILDDSASKGLISHSVFLEKYQDYSCIKIILDKQAPIISTFGTTTPGLDSRLPSPDDIAYVIYTSGTTGTPKGVKIQHAAICNLVRAESTIFHITSQDKVFQGFSISFDASLEEIWLAFFAGAQLFVGSEDTLQSGSQMATFINENKITVFSTVPTLLSTIIEELSSVKTLILGGEDCSMELVKKWSTPKRRMINTYGPTEATVIATFADCKPEKKVTIGRPVVNYSTYILDENQQMVPAGIAGELCIGGLSLAEGYINNNTLTTSKFITPVFQVNPSFPLRLYRSGDLVRFNPEGEIEFLGRIDSQVKLRGFRIELAEIESQLLKIQAVKKCALAVRKDPSGLEHLIAYVVINNEISFDPILVKKELRTKLAPYMIPSRFEMISEIPLLSSGKIDRKRLPEPFFQKDLSENKTNGDTTIENITRLWESIFGMGTIRPNDNFFELGGHSLLASQMISELRKDVRYEKLSVKDVYSHPTVEKLTHFIEHTVKFANNQENSKKPAPPVIKKTSRLTYTTVSVLQFLTTTFFYGITATILLFPLFLRDLISGITNAEIILSVFGSFAFFYFFWMGLSIIAKWVVIGKFKAGSYPLWGFYYFRFWLVKKFVDMTPVSLMSGTPFINWYFRLLGAKIGKNTYLGTDRLRIFDLITIGDDSSLLKESTLLGYSIENGLLHIGSITVGNRCMIGARSMLAKDTLMQDDSMLLELSMLGDHETIPKGEVWKGSPACPFKPKHDYINDETKRLTGFKKAGFRFLQVLALLFVLFFPQLLAAPFGYFYYKIISNYGLIALLPASLPLIGLFIFLFCLSISAFKWLLIGKQKPMDIRLDSLLYIRKWIVDTMTFMSLTFFRSIYATLFLPQWLRTTGVKVGKRAEISTLNHLSTDLLEIGNESFLADSTSIGVPMVYLGSIYLRDTHIGDRSFIGNSAVLLPGSKIGNDCLIGVLSTAPDTADGEKINGSSWLGSPPMYLPNRQESPKFSDKLTFHPPWYLYIARGTIEFFKITMPYAIASWLIICFYEIIYPLNETENFLPLILTAMLLFTALSYSTMIFGLLSKWLLIGRYKPDARPLWSSYVWRNEFINSITECLVFPLYQNMMLGTPMAPLFFRMMGSKIGEKVYMETTEITEFDLVHIHSDSALNFGSTIQTHLFEDRVMKMSVVEIGKSCTIGAMSVVLYDSKMGNHAVLDGLSLLMKGETLPACTKWQGSPCGRIN
jgi:non-ribosomal peptide synthetase-like protein